MTLSTGACCVATLKCFSLSSDALVLEAAGATTQLTEVRFGSSVEMFCAIFAGAGVGSSGNSISGAGNISAMFFGGSRYSCRAFFGDIVGDRGDNVGDIDTGVVGGSASVDKEIVEGVDNRSVLIWFIVKLFFIL
jgi:hypothetical protein